ncbi:MAG: hypothetical protein LJE62_14705 [Silicimonas sp.]|nr:hypothetical protein [Silicimonas sp.]
MSQKNTLNSVAFVAVFALAVFLVALGLMLFVGKFAIFGSIFMALVVAIATAIFLLIGFGGPAAQALPVARQAAPPAPEPVAEPAPAEPAHAEPEMPDTSEADREAEEAAERARAQAAAAEAEAARRSAEEQAARDKAEADARAAAEAEAARKAAEAAAAAPQPAPEPEPAAPASGEASRPAGLDGPRDGTADDLKQIKGVGPKMEQVCNRLGFWHFDQIAAWTDEEVAWVDANLEGFPGRVSRDNWVEQAKILASGGETEFSKRVEDGDVY